MTEKVDDPVVRAASELIGGPRGRYAAARELPWVLTAALLSALTAVTAGLAILLRAPCLRTGFAGDTQFWSACYADLPTAYRDANVKAGLAAYLQGGDGAPVTGQPPLTGLVLTAVASLAPDDGSLKTRAAWYFALWSVLLTLLLLVIVWLVASSAARPISAAHVALSPVVVLAGFVSADLLGVALASAGMWAWSRRNPTLAGVLLGLAIGARTYPVLILVAIALLCVRSGRLHEMGRVVGYALLTFGALLSGLWLLNREAAASPYQGWASAGAGYGSPWLLPQLAGHPLPTGAVTALAVVGWLVALVAGAVLALSSARRPTIAEVSLVMVGIVLVTGKSFTVQSSVWLLPLVAWCALQWRDHLIWAGAETLNFVAVWLTIAATTVPDRGLPASWYAFFSMLRVVAVLWLVAVVWLRARDRWSRSKGEPDDLAGPMSGAEDRLIVRFS
ncbi:glycosyltransferase 87 family protein [Terrabacter sp. Ter38]|uniref:glycosyltransferase 87 family protein n=1 Tax=Terrabacter sp. Ter38 TaxID=2926030 RepID=UPI00211969D0|nr:glycosyltransferase 87 family protein [Terrabacter sp. Ter38]